MLYTILIIVITICSVINRESYPAGLYITVPLLLIAAEVHGLKMALKSLKLKFGIQNVSKTENGKE